MKLRFTNQQAVNTWFDRVTHCADDDPSLGVYSANHRIMGRGHTLYSYGTHYPLARWFPEYRAFLTNTSHRRSSSTSKHQSYVRSAQPESTIDVGIIVGLDPVADAPKFLEHFENRIRRCLEKSRRARRHKSYWQERADFHLGTRLKFTRIFGVRAYELPEDVTAALVTLKLAA